MVAENHHRPTSIPLQLAAYFILVIHSICSGPEGNGSRQVVALRNWSAFVAMAEAAQSPQNWHGRTSADEAARLLSPTRKIDRKTGPHRILRSSSDKRASLLATQPLNLKLKEKQILDQILGVGVYDRRIRPSGIFNDTDGKSSTIVNVNLYLRSINDIDDYKMEFSVQVTFREQWNDGRLKFDDHGGRFTYLTLTDPNKVWMPDTFFRNEKKGHIHAILVNNAYVRVFPDGDVLYSIRISLTLSCPMNLKLYPMDRQTCSLKIASYGYTTDDITYQWKARDPVQVAQGLNLPRFSVEKYTSSYCNAQTNTGEYSCLSVDLVFKRQFSYYLITIYVPGCMLVIVSWVSFWLDPHAVPARVSLGVTTLLTMSTQTASINNSLPPVAYTKAIDVWQGVCVTFVFSALLEYALVNYALRGEKPYLLKRQAHQNWLSNKRLGTSPDMEAEFQDETEDEEASGRIERRLLNQSVSTRTRQFFLDKSSRARKRQTALLSKIHLSNVFVDQPVPEISKDFAIASPAPDTFCDGSLIDPIDENNTWSGIKENASCTTKRTASLRRKMDAPLFSELSEGDLHLEPGQGIKGGALSRSVIMSLSAALSSKEPAASLTVAAASVAAKKHPRFKLGRTPMDRAKRIDVISRFFFPLVFAVFNLSYWTIYLLQAHKEYKATVEKE